MIIGSHVSFKNQDQLLGSVKEALSYDANTFMFYTGSTQSTSRGVLNDELTYEAYKLMVDNNINSDKKETQDNPSDNNNIINEMEKNIEEKEKKLSEEKKEALKNESEFNTSSFFNQSSFLSQSAILAEQFVLISRDPNAPFTIENTLKFDKTQCLGILDFLTIQEKMQFTGINRGFIIERIYLLNYKREEMIRSLELSPNETVDDLITKTRLKYSNDELTKSFNEFQIAKGGANAVELLNKDLYSKLFKKTMIEKNPEEICAVYRVLFSH